MIQKLNRAIVATMVKPEIAEKDIAMGMESATSTPDELAVAVREALKKYAPVVKSRHQGGRHEVGARPKPAKT